MINDVRIVTLFSISWTVFLAVIFFAFEFNNMMFPIAWATVITIAILVVRRIRLRNKG